MSPHPEVYLPMAQSRSQSYGFVLLHTSGNANDALPALRAVVATLPARRAASIDPTEALRKESQCPVH